MEDDNTGTQKALAAILRALIIETSMRLPEDKKNDFVQAITNRVHRALNGDIATSEARLRTEEAAGAHEITVMVLHSLDLELLVAQRDRAELEAAAPRHQDP